MSYNFDMTGDNALPYGTDQTAIWNLASGVTASLSGQTAVLYIFSLTKPPVALLTKAVAINLSTNILSVAFTEADSETLGCGLFGYVIRTQLAGNRDDLANGFFEVSINSPLP